MLKYIFQKRRRLGNIFFFLHVKIFLHTWRSKWSDLFPHINMSFHRCSFCVKKHSHMRHFIVMLKMNGWICRWINERFCCSRQNQSCWSLLTFLFSRSVLCSRFVSVTPQRLRLISAAVTLRLPRPASSSPKNLFLGSSSASPRCSRSDSRLLR